ncbi:hypothetical protein [Streptomyces sp. S.PNR 29]|uniref:hypothetical protein n=1 Tax=Streptomyces sp. S.PNR 29 TaxID=2973805 RepID=UPI0025B1A0E8|nr:hypothetical protein [Streptomyces sp. S.PNR 29]MDN0198574.1 hypothetical protein [Streptomyces sp. S.PNR 29]
MVTPSEVTPAPATKPPKRASAPGPDVPRIVPRRHVGRWLTAAVALLLFAMVLNSVVRNDAFQWDVVGRYFTTAAVLDGLLLSLWLTAVVMVLGFLLGTVLAVMRLSANPVLRTLSGCTSSGVDLLIGTLKGTSIVSVLAVHDLLYSVQLIYNQTYQVIPLLMVATLWYIAVTTVLSAGQFHVERYYARGNSRALPPTPLQRLRGHLTAVRRRLNAATAADARPAIGGDR